MRFISSVMARLWGVAGEGQKKTQKERTHYVEHQPPSTCSSIVAYATATGGKQRNQDYADDRCLDGCNVLTIADGLSGSQYSELAAKAAVEGFLRKITEVWKQNSTATIGRAEIREAYYTAHADIKKRAEQEKKEKRSRSLNPQTTFIGIIDLPDRFIFTYIGDGAIALFRANTDEGAILHSSKSLLITHSVAGFLTRVLSADGKLPKFGYMEVDKTLEGGEIVVAGTDGALPLGSVLKTSQGILSDLKHAFQENREGFDRDTVRRLLLQKVEHEFTTDDNRTLGVILTNDALDSWWKEQQREEKRQRGSSHAQE